MLDHFKIERDVENHGAKDERGAEAGKIDIGSRPEADQFERENGMLGFGFDLEKEEGGQKGKDDDGGHPRVGPAQQVTAQVQEENQTGDRDSQENNSRQIKGLEEVPDGALRILPQLRTQ